MKYYEYENGRIKSVTDFMGNKTEMYYDAAGNLQKTIDCDGKAQINSWKELNLSDEC